MKSNFEFTFLIDDVFFQEADDQLESDEIGRQVQRRRLFRRPVEV